MFPSPLFVFRTCAIVSSPSPSSFLHIPVPTLPRRQPDHKIFSTNNYRHLTVTTAPSGVGQAPVLQPRPRSALVSTTIAPVVAVTAIVALTDTPLATHARGPFSAHPTHDVVRKKSGYIRFQASLISCSSSSSQPHKHLNIPALIVLYVIMLVLVASRGFPRTSNWLHISTRWVAGSRLSL